jgi:gliding motility-associated-like protein
MNKVLLFMLSPFFLSAQTAFISGNDTICGNGETSLVKIDFNGISPYTFVYAIDGLNQSVISTNINPYHLTTSNSGEYTLTSFSDANGFGSYDGSAIINLLESPVASIHLQSDTLSINYPIANFISKSVSINPIISWRWDFGDNTSSSSLENTTHEYKDSSAIYQASLIVIDINGCSDTATNTLWIRDEFWIYIPNSFTPDFDMINDNFCINYNGIRDNTVLFKVFNSLGELMFQSNNFEELRCDLGNGWNGKHIDSNSDLPADTYAYEIYFQDFEGWKYKDYGTIVLIR